MIVYQRWRATLTVKSSPSSTSLLSSLSSSRPSYLERVEHEGSRAEKTKEPSQGGIWGTGIANYLRDLSLDNWLRGWIGMNAGLHLNKRRIESIFADEALLSDGQSRVRLTLQWFFSQFCQAHMCTIQLPSRGKSFLERFLKKFDFSSTGKVLVMQILVSCIDSFFDSILLFYAKFPFIW